MKEMGNLFLHIVKEIERGFYRPTERVVTEITEMIFEESQNEVPVDTGALKGSGRYKVEAVQVGSGTQYFGTIEYGGETTTGPTRNAPDGVVRYANIVHERWKPFLEIAYNNVKDRAVRKIRRYLGGVAKQVVKVPRDLT